MADRAVAPVVEKLLTIGIVLLFVGGTTTAVLGGTVPGYRDAVGAELGDRVLAKATVGVEEAVPPVAARVESTTAVDVPVRIRGRQYRILVRNRTLVLDHPRRAVGGQARLTLPDSVVRVDGRWTSVGPNLVIVTHTSEGLAVNLQEERP